jgi:hypothetical protein
LDNNAFWLSDERCKGAEWSQTFNSDFPGAIESDGKDCSLPAQFIREVSIRYCEEVCIQRETGLLRRVFQNNLIMCSEGSSNATDAGREINTRHRETTSIVYIYVAGEEDTLLHGLLY